jgi:hypothetical protein
MNRHTAQQKDDSPNIVIPNSPNFRNCKPHLMHLPNPMRQRRALTRLSEGLAAQPHQLTEALGKVRPDRTARGTRDNIRE